MHTGPVAELPLWASKEMKDIYGWLQDEESKFIFVQYLGFFIRKDYRFKQDCALGALAYSLRRLENSEEEHALPASFIQLILDCRRKKIKRLVVYPAGAHAAFTASVLAMHGIKVDLFCDRDPAKQGGIFCGAPVISPQDLIEYYPDSAVLVATYNSIDIWSDLRRMGAYDNGATSVFTTQGLGEGIYFGPAFMRPVADEVYVDVGTNDGCTIMPFVSFCGGKYKKIYGMEAHPRHYQKAVINTKALDNVELVNKGAWNQAGCLTFFGDRNTLANLIPQSGGRHAMEVQTMKIDDLVGDAAVTLIVMDIEGAEYEALQGARKTIIENKPRLAISMYHREDDFIRLPRLMRELLPGHRLFIRQHALGPHETILYAVP